MSRIRRSDLLFMLLALGTLLFCATLIDAAAKRSAAGEALSLMHEQVKKLQLSDLSLFTEARYTRHLSQADRFSAFQDHPLALEHFPSGSLLLPPQTLRDPR